MLTNELQNANNYTDFQGLAGLRREAGANSADALEKVAKQFEALFTQMMLKSMRDAGGGDGLFDNDQSRLYQDMYDKQLSLSLSDGGSGMGLAKMLVQQLRSSVPELNAQEKAGANSPDGQVFDVPARGSTTFSLSAQTEVSRPQVAEPQQFDSPEHFVATLWPHAQSAAKTLGVDPKALMAQAALETGWGKAVIRKPDGSSSFNLFNIKADHRWQGGQVGKMTLEYRDGIAQKEQASFRAYDSYAQSFEDYTDFLQRHPRYREALKAGIDSGVFAERLQEAGYATDPEYAGKIKRIINSELMADALTGLKLPDERTLS